MSTKSQEIFQENPHVQEERPQKRSSRPQTSPVSYGARQSFQFSSRRPSTSMMSSRRYKSPYEEPPITYVLKQGKTLPPPRKTQQLSHTTNFGHIPRGPQQAPVVVVTSRNVPEAVDYRTRTEHWKQFDKTYEHKWNEKYSRKHKHSPYKEKLYDIRESAIIETKRMIKQRDLDSARERKREVDIYNKSVEREYEIERNYPKGDIIHNKQRTLRIMITG